MIFKWLQWEFFVLLKLSEFYLRSSCPYNLMGSGPGIRWTSKNGELREKKGGKVVKVLFVASEAVPFIKTGGLADVIGSLPKELRKLDIDARVILPKYGDIPEHFKESMVLQERIKVPLGWRNQYCDIEKIEYQGVTVYFIDNEYYFKRPGLYGFEDEAERYAFFCRAVLEALPHLDFTPQILHCHDWQSGMVSVFLKSHYAHNPFYQGMRTVFTIHNLKYQGVFPEVILGDLLDLGYEHFTMESLEFYGGVSFIKGGLVYSDKITTVSKSYTVEIQYPFFGEKLDGLLRKRKDDFYGILNGIDYDIFNPASDPHVFMKYNLNTFEKKLKNKTELQKKLGLPVREDVPLIAIISRLVSQKGLDLVECVLKEILDMDIQLVVLGTGEEKYENLFKDAAINYPDKVSTHITFNQILANQIYAGSDLFLMPSFFEPCGLGQMISLRYGSLPIVREIGGLRDTVQSFNEVTYEGNGFSFSNYNAHDMLYTIGRAVQFYQDQELWAKIVSNAMTSDNSWNNSAMEYEALYQGLLE